MHAVELITQIAKHVQSQLQFTVAENWLNGDQFMISWGRFNGGGYGRAYMQYNVVFCGHRAAFLINALHIQTYYYADPAFPDNLIRDVLDRRNTDIAVTDIVDGQSHN